MSFDPDIKANLPKKICIEMIFVYLCNPKR